MHMSSRTLRMLIGGVVAATAVLVVGFAQWPAPESVRGSSRRPLLNGRGAATSTADGLASRAAEMQGRLDADPEDVEAGIVLAEVLLRQSRASATSAPAVRAEQALRGVLRVSPSNHAAQRMLGATLLSLHRFGEALEAGHRARDQQPDDAWSYGVIGDAALELGDYDAAFGAFQQMMDCRPGAPAYARASYARELQGDVEGALQSMQMALNATSPGDPEARAWALVQLGELLLRMGRTAEAERHLMLADRAYPGYVLAASGLARVALVRGDTQGAIDRIARLLERAPSLQLAATMGDLHHRQRRDDEAERYYVLAETIGRQQGSDESLAGFLAERDRRNGEAVALARKAAAARRDIFTMDALGGRCTAPVSSPRRVRPWRRRFEPARATGASSTMRRRCIARSATVRAPSACWRARCRSTRSSTSWQAVPTSCAWPRATCGARRSGAEGPGARARGVAGRRCWSRPARSGGGAARGCTRHGRHARHGDDRG